MYICILLIRGSCPVKGRIIDFAYGGIWSSFVKTAYLSISGCPICWWKESIKKTWVHFGKVDSESCLFLFSNCLSIDWECCQRRGLPL